MSDECLFSMESGNYLVFASLARLVLILLDSGGLVQNLCAIFTEDYKSNFM